MSFKVRHCFGALTLLASLLGDHAAAQETPAGGACDVVSVDRNPRTWENYAISPRGDFIAASELDKAGVYQVYVGRAGSANFACISCAERTGVPRLDRNKPMLSWHLSGEWLVVGVEENQHDNAWMPRSWQRGLLQSGIWLNIWITTPNGDRWTQITDFRKSRAAPSDGFVGVAFTPDGRTAVWAEIIDGNVFANAFGVWRLIAAEFQVVNGKPGFANRRDITPAGARWVEPGNFAPDGKRLLISADIGMPDAQGQDQYTLDIVSGEVRNLTNTPGVWDEHGLFSPDGRSILFMSSYPYRSRPRSHQVANLKTEFMLMNDDGSNLRQLTYFNAPSHPESQRAKTIAAVAQFVGDGSTAIATVMAEHFTKTNWTISFAGQCGGG